ncbi:MAG: hypothetical protein A2Y80_10590 [Deltaproteobacteria bacterium RBG_13_58_19]|nr:MAG: hypothetical protein A2Y80_10590 [Deltaproteobacteria bacterium RBG_13_58_19]
MLPPAPTVWRVYVNQEPVDLIAGMTVRHALISARLLEEVERGDRRVYDAWGNEVGLEGALAPEMKLYVK